MTLDTKNFQEFKEIYTSEEFAEILNSIKISEGCDDKILQQEMLPISHAILQMMPNRLFRYRSCSDASVEAFVNDKIYAVI